MFRVNQSITNWGISKTFGLSDRGTKKLLFSNPPNIERMRFLPLYVVSISVLNLYASEPNDRLNDRTYPTHGLERTPIFPPLPTSRPHPPPTTTSETTSPHPWQ